MVCVVLEDFKWYRVLEVMWGFRWCVECNRFNVVSGGVWGVEDCVKCKGWRWFEVLEDCVGVIGVWDAKRS